MKRFLVAAVGALALALAPAAIAGDLVLAPTSYGAHTFASWRAQEGLPDTVGFANQALVLDKDTFDAGPAAVAVIRGVEGIRAQNIAGLEWERRVPDTDCNKTSPRWELVVQARKRQHTISFGCAASAHGPGSAPNWVRDVNTKTAIRARLLAAGKDVAAGQVVSLAIVFDQRTKTGLAILDNVKVLAAGLGSNVWTFAGDNAAVVPGTMWSPRVDPFDSADFLTFEELWPTLTPEAQALAASDDEIVDTDA